MSIKVEKVEIKVIERIVPGTAGDVNIKNQSLQKAYGSVVAMRVHCEGGVSGEIMTIGPAPGIAHELKKWIAPWLVGKDITQRERIWQDLWDYKRLWLTNPWIISLTDICLWDAFAKSVKLPLNQVLGAYGDRLPAYASSFTLPTIDHFVAQALEYKAKGYPAYKIHVFGTANKDIELCTRVREAVGPDYDLMVDAVSAYTYLDALKVGRALGELDFFWFEEPIRDYYLHNYRELCRQLTVPVMSGEMHEGMHFSQPEYIVSGATDIVRADVLIKGGIGPVMKTAALAEAFGLLLEIHTFANPMIDVANLHCGTAIKNTTYFEQLVPRDLVTFGVVEELTIDKNGFAIVPKKPGLGLEIDWAYINKHSVDFV